MAVVKEGFKGFIPRSDVAQPSPAADRGVATAVLATRTFNLGPAAPLLAAVPSPCSLRKGNPQLVTGSQTQGCSCPKLPGSLSLSLQDSRQSPSGLPGTVLVVESSDQSVSPRKASNSSWGSRSHRTRCSSQALFFQPDSSPVRKSFLPARLASLSLQPEVFLSINLWFSSMKCQLGQEGGSWGRIRTDHANWNETQIQGFAFKQIPNEVWCWSHP